MRYLFALTAICAVALVFITCQNNQTKEEKIARQYCGTCHAFPEPSLLPKKVWAEGVLPQMAIFLGVKKIDLNSGVLIEDLPAIYEALPAESMVTEEQWKAIQTYYAQNAPDSLTFPAAQGVEELKQFDISAITLPIKVNSEVTLLQADTVNDHIYVGTRNALLYQFTPSFTLQDSFVVKSTPSQVRLTPGEPPVVLTMGIMNPNDQELGQLVELNPANHTSTVLIDSMKRPVFVDRADFNGDRRPDYIACEFGNFTGAVTIYESSMGDVYRKRILHPLPGARRVIIRDVDGNGTPDIIALMTQGDENIVLFSNMGNFQFKVTRLLQFPPVYGSSYFDIADFNNDGKFDILYTNGDNADDSQILKPYHGVRIFMNDGNNQFEESWSFPMHGASQAVARDFDGDGDMDIAAISYFPDYSTPDQSFLYFENRKGDYIAQTTPLATEGRWMVMETADIDNDGDDDIILGAMNFPSGIPEAFKLKWMHDKNSLLVLRNKQKQASPTAP